MYNESGIQVNHSTSEGKNGGTIRHEHQTTKD